MIASVLAVVVSQSQFSDMRWRYIGPLRGGRTQSAVGVPDKPSTYYIASVNGGVFRTDDAGRTWRPIFDREPTGSIGSLAIAPSDDNVIYAGSGEGMQRPDLSVGDGVYKSTDAGATWTHLGLRDGQQIPQIAVDPKDPNRLFVAVLGHPYGPNPERGIYRSTDGGATFKQVLFKDENTGANDVKIDVNDPKVVYATLWAARSAPWEAGPFYIAGSGVFKSTDGGDTWNKLSSGLPPRIGRSELAISRSNSNVVYVAAEDTDGCAIYRSDDGGEHFTLTSSDDRVCSRSGDLLTLTVAPDDPNTVYATSTSAYRSTDGGKTFVPYKGAPGGDDYISTWINPANPDDMILGSDQGAQISLDRGKTWSSWYNQPTAQLYHVNTDNRFPYWVCGGQQDSGSACVSSRGDWGQVNERDWHPSGAEEYGYVVPDPLHPGVTFGGKVERFDERTNQAQEVSPNPLRAKPYRVVRTEPIAFDHLDPHVMYFAANQVYMTRDGGMHWKIISPDLTRAHWAMPASIAAFESGDPEKGQHRGVVYALAPSYTHAGTLWAGTDDGQVWITRDRGGHWKNVTPQGISAWSKISQIDAGRSDDNTAYIAVNRIRLNDMHPHVYRTHDGGAHWTEITNGLPVEPVNAARVDPKVPGLLYAAMEADVYVSFDDGNDWQSLQLNLPHSSNRDIVVHDDDLVVATHGRGFWILDDVEPLRELARTQSWRAPHLFAPSLAYRVLRNTNTDTPLPPEVEHGENPPDGAILDYVLPGSASNVAIVIRDEHGNVMRRYSSSDVAPAPIDFDKPSYWERPFTKPSTDPGMHRFVWDFREPSPLSLSIDLPISANDEDTPRTPQGPLLVPGHYTVTLNVDGRVSSQPLTIVMDPRSTMTRSELAEQYAMAHATASIINNSYAVMQRAKARKDMKAVRALGRLNGTASALLGLVDEVDAPVPQGTHDAFCSLSAQARALGAGITTTLCGH